MRDGDGQIIIPIEADNRPLKQTLSETSSELEKAGKTWERTTSDAAQGMQGSMLSFLKSIGAAFAASKVVKTLIGWGKAAVDAASDLREVQNVVDVTFGDRAQQINVWAKKAQTQFGLTEAQAKRFTSTLGAMMKSAGMSGPEIVEMSTDLAGLAADMASFYNLDFDTAFQKIRSGISGETEPLKQLGINMSVANLEAYALSQGISTAFEKMSQGEQTMLRYQYLMQATSDAQGDFERTSTGFANASRRVQTALESIKTSLGNVLMNYVEPLTGRLANLLETLSTPAQTTVLDEFNSIDVDTESKLANIAETALQANNLIETLREINNTPITLSNGETTTYEQLFGEMAKVRAAGGDVNAYLARLGLNVEQVNHEYNKWLEVTRRLTGAIPGLNSVINAETGELKGGIEAVEDYVSAWEKGQMRIAYTNALEKKRSALAQAMASVAETTLELEINTPAYNKIMQQLESLKQKVTEAGAQFDEAGNLIASNGTDEVSAALDQLEQFLETNGYVIERQKQLTQSLDDQNAALEDARKNYIASQKALEEMGGALGDAAKALDDGGKAAQEWSTEQVAAGKAALAAMQSVANELQAYYKSVYDDTKRSIEQTLKGLEEVTTPMQELEKRRAEITTKLWEAERGEIKLTEDDIKRLQDEKDKLAEPLSAWKLNQNIKSQMGYISDYLDNMEKARQMGFSDELLASISSGSAEDADYLSALVGATSAQVESINSDYARLVEMREEFAKELTDSKLTPDQQFSSMVKNLNKSIQDLDMADGARSAMSATVEGIAQGIAEQVGYVQNEVDALNAALAGLGAIPGLSAFGHVFSFGSSFVGSFLKQKTDGSHANGLDYVPFNGYLAELHEGESVLPAEEARVWRNFRYGQQASRNNIDYNALSGAIWENAPNMGGNVYLDGQTVGRILSAQQADSYRALQRSGWKG